MYALYELSIWIILPARAPLVQFDSLDTLTRRPGAARALYADFVRTFGNVLFAVSLFVVWGLLTLVGVVVDQGQDPNTLLSELRGADRARDPAPQLRQHLSLAVVRRHHRFDLALAGGLHVQARHPGAAPAAAPVSVEKIPLHASFETDGDPPTCARRVAELLRRARLANTRTDLRRNRVELRRQAQLGAARRARRARRLRHHRGRHDALLGARLFGEIAAAHGPDVAGPADARADSPGRLRLQDRADHDQERNGLSADRLRLARHGDR